MKSRTIFVLFSLVFLLLSCTSKKDAVKPSELIPPPPPEEFKLPDEPVSPRQEPKVIEQTGPHIQAVLIEEDMEEKYILLNFENTDIKTIISTFSELLNINYILTPGVAGSVTIQSYRKFPVSDLFNIFQTILEINGLTAVKDGEFYRIVPIDTAKQQPLAIERGRDTIIKLDSSFITQLIPLQYVKAADIANILKSLMPRGTDIIIYEPTNMLIVTSVPKTLGKFMKIVDALDISDAEVDTIKTFVYHVENGEAKALEEILRTIFADSKKAAAPAPVRATTPATPARRRTAAAPAPTPASPSSTSLPGEVGDISVTAYGEINALIVKSTPRDYLALLEILKKIDVPRKQVMIEVVIAEINLTGSLQYGLEWLIRTGSGDTVGFTSSAAEDPPTITDGFPGGFAAVVTGAMSDDLFSYLITAVQGKTDVNVLATPLILAMDNTEALIKIGSEVPTATSTTAGIEGSQITQQIQYRSVGTILTVTPHITEKGNVSMKLQIESSDVIEEGRTIGTGSFPEFTTRNATTSAVVESGHTLFLGGIISESKSKSRTGIPILSRIPILGALFGTSSRTSGKRELFVMVTPHVIANQDDADDISQEFQNRVKTIREKIGSTEKEEEPSPKTEDSVPTEPST